MFSQEYYDHELMKRNRHEAIERAAEADTWGLILGTLGRQVRTHHHYNHHYLDHQGHPPVLERLQEQAEAAGKAVVTVLLSEIFPQKLALMSSVGAWVQVACPR